MSVLACLVMLLLGANIASAQSGDRRGEPNVLSTGYYVVDSDDDASPPWRPNYFFVDTSYQPVTWTRIANGARQFAPPGRFFYNPWQWNDIANMDTADNAIAGPMPIGFTYNFYGVDYDSVYISTNGFIGFRPYAEAIGTSAVDPTSYMARDNKDFKPGGSFSSGPRAIIAALWADLDVRTKNDTSRVYVRTSLSLDTFMVNYYNFRLRPGSPNVFSPSFTASGADRLMIRKFQIVLARTDSSVQINYGPFSGAINSFPPVLAWRVFQNNVSIGLVNHTRTEATSLMYRAGTPAGWNAINAGCPTCNKNFRQNGQYAVKFKQWKNVVRAVSVAFPTRNYEICLGSTPVSPRATFRNVDLKTQSFKVRFSIRNVVTGIAVYGRALSLVNVPPGKDTTVTFSNYATNPNILSQLGTFRACAIATTYDTSDVNIGDRWPFDDTSCVRIFGIRRTAQPFNDASNNYSVTSNADIPDQHKWISIGAQVVDGEGDTFDPPPPRDENGVGPRQFKSPVIKIDRNDIEGNEYSGVGGDSLLSFPINLQGITKTTLAYSYQRSGRMTYPWLFDADVMFGPEHTVLNVLGGVVRRGDSMLLEFKKPTEPGCNPSASGWNRITAVDGGHDFEFQKFFTRVESWNRPGVNYFTADFRFRLRLLGKYDGSFLPPPSDDGDAWYLDNLSIQSPRKPEIEVLWVRVVSPYTKMPASQAVSLPIYVKIANNASDVAIAFPIRVQVVGPDGETKYWQTQTVTSIKGNSDSVIQMPNWNAANASVGGGQEYVIHAWIAQEGYDSYEDDNGTYTKFNLMVEQEAGLTQEFAYDDAGLNPQPNDGNDWPAVTQRTGQGVGFNNNSGSFATKFRLVTKDTLYGVRVYFGNANQSPDAIRISVLEGNPNSSTPGDLVVQPNVKTVFPDERKGDFFNKFWPYYFPTPIVLPGGVDAPGTKGVYWLSVSQLSLDNMVMGADISRGGGLIRIADNFTPSIIPIYSSPYGTQASSQVNNGDVSTVWALEVTAGTGNWAGWMPSNGWWPTNGNAGNPLASATNVNFTYNIWGGSYTPMIRPLVSRAIMLPVEFAVPLEGKAVDGKALLTWTTANEKNNIGFFVERQDAAASEAMWEKAGFVASKTTNSSTATGYSYVDNVTPGTYNYRIIQTDVDGAESVSNTVNVTIGAPSAYALSAAYPNPFSVSTKFAVSVPTAGPAVVEIYNAIGQVVNVVHNGELPVGSTEFRWDGKDQVGNELSAGTYLVRVTSGSYTESMKITLTK
jgi:hypothetical protein